FIFETYLPNSLMICNACDLKNLENDMVLLGKKKNQPQEKYSKTYKNILDDVLADIQVEAEKWVGWAMGQKHDLALGFSTGQTGLIMNLANELLPSLPNGTITLPSSTNVSVKSSPEISAREKLLTDKHAAFWNGPSSCCDSGLVPIEMQIGKKNLSKMVLKDDVHRHCAKPIAIIDCIQVFIMES
ncbi:hypothetical protein Tco_1359094, partial [Tanacetum coccineum]